MPLAWRSSALWGTDLLFYQPPLIQGLFLLAAVLLFVPAFRRQVRTWIRALPLALWDSGRRTWLAKALIVLAALGVFVALHTANHLLGDGYLYLRDLDAGLPQSTQRAPLTFALIQVLHSAGSPLWETAENTYRLYSYASGVLFVLLSFPVAGTIGTTPREKSIVLALLLSGGYLQLFFGYVETYALCLPGILLYLLLGLRVLEDRMSVLAPAILLSLLVNLHLVLALLAPSLLVLGWHRHRNTRGCATRWRSGLATGAVLCFIPLSAALFLWLTDIDPVTYLSRLGVSHLLPVLSEPGFHEPYRLFSLAHVLDFLNLQALAAPGAWMALALLDKRALGHHFYLLTAAAFPLVFTFLANPEIGAFRDWDFLSLPALPLTVWAASALLARLRDPNSSFRKAFVICGAAALHCLMWVGLNASPTASESRYAHLMDKLTGHAASYGWETLGSYYRLQDNPESELKAQKRALEASPDNPRHWINVGVVHAGQGQYEDAIPYFHRAIQIDSNRVAGHVNLGAANQALNRMEAARSNLARVLELDPHNPQAEEIRRSLLNAYQRSLGADPDNPRHWVNVGVIHAMRGQYEEAIPYFHTAIQIDPDLVAGHVNLGSSYQALNRMEEARSSLARVLELDPHNPQAEEIRRFLAKDRE